MTTRVYPAEHVLPGHPDKLCDAIADALVQEAGRREKRALCGVEVAVHRDHVFITGRIACRDADTIAADKIAREVFTTAGYDRHWYPSPSKLKIRAELCLGPLEEGESEFRGVSDDQSIVTGYAIDLPGTNYLPPEHWLAYRLSRRLEYLRTTRPELMLGPDGKVVVFYEQDVDTSWLHGFSASLQQAIGGDTIELHRAVRQELEGELAATVEAIPGFVPQLPETISVNGAGNFAVGGPEGDNGLSGKKLVVDAYGPRVPIGGGALSGKDFYKADRAGAIIARRLAKAIVLAGVARECFTTVAFTPGAAQCNIVSVQAEDGRLLDAARFCRLLDLGLNGAGDRYTESTNLVEIARHGHFTGADRPWERLGLDSETETGKLHVAQQA